MVLLGGAFSGPPEHLPKGSQVLRVPHWGVQTTGPGHIDVEAFTAASSHLENRMKRDMIRAESQEGNPRMSVLQDQLFYPLHFQMEKQRG